MNILDTYFRDNKYFITKHHLDSYDQFLKLTVKTVLKSMNPFSIPKYDENNKLLYSIEVVIGGENGDEIIFKNTDLYPNECRIRNVSYTSELCANIYITIVDHSTNKESKQTMNDTFLCYIPIMLHSSICVLKGKSKEDLVEMGECPYDQGGYFIIDGKEKVIVAQEETVSNKLFVEKAKDDKYKYQAFIRCTSEKDSVFPKTLWLYTKENNAVYVKIPHIETQIPLFVLYRALGVESDFDIINNILQGEKNETMYDFLRASVIDANFIYDQNDALDFLKEFTDFKSVENVLYVLYENFFPNAPQDLIQKMKYMSEVVKQMVEVCCGRTEPSDRDNYMSKRIGISGFLIGDIFKDFYNNFRVETMKRIDNHYEFGNVKNIFHKNNKIFSASEKFQNGLLKSLKGNWGMSNDSTKQGIVQDLNRISYLGFISHLRRVNTPMDSSIKIRKPHQLSSSQYGMMCPCESPDGASIGLLKNMAILCHISFKISYTIILVALSQFFKIIKLDDFDFNNYNKSVHTKLFINNNLYGFVMEPYLITKFIRLLRRNGYINIFISISWNVFDNCIFVLTDSGRPTRPLLIVNDGKLTVKPENLKGSWKSLVIGQKNIELVKDEYHDTFINPFKTDDTIDNVIKKLEATQGCIEYIDVHEANNSLIATKDLISEYTTHCEIHPSTMFSAYTATIPFSNHSPGTRITFSGAQGKQAIGVYATNFNNRIDTLSYLLHYPQKPIVSTRYMDYLNASKLPHGENLIVAIGCYTGYNQEDSIIVNKTSIERGMFNLTYFKSYVSTEHIEKNNKNEKHIFFANPNVLKHENNVKLTRFADYSKIDENGLPILESYIDEDDCIIGKCMKNVEYTFNGDPEKDIFVSKSEKTSYESKCEIADKTTIGYVDKIVVFENESGEKEAKIRLRKVRKPELGDKMACYSSDTEVLTDKGWIYWYDLTLNHKVATLSATTLDLVYEHPKKILAYEFKEKHMYVLENDQVSLSVTPNHKLMVSKHKITMCYNLIDAQYLQGDYYMTKGLLHNTHGINENENDLILYSQCLKYGRQISINGRQISKSSFVNEKIYEAVSKAIESGTKHLAEFVWDLSSSCALLVLKTLFEDTNIIYKTECDLNDVQRLALHAGKSATIVNNESVELDRKSDVYFNSDSFKKIGYIGKVYCCEMSSGIVYVRRNGKGLFCGNSRHGQKGVIGAILPHEMMPFTKDGLVPDIIINPHAFPSRMTIGHLIECILAKSGSKNGFDVDGTAFENQDYKTISDVLENKGYNKNADEIMYNGITGEQMKCEIFIGPTYYFRLKHMVADKINSRDSGQVVGMTHQPTKGRGNGGGLRIGEMETNVLISYGISSFTKESMMERSDNYTINVSKESGLVIPINEKNKIVYEPYSKYNIPYSCKQLIYELQSMSIGARLQNECDEMNEDYDVFELDNLEEPDDI